MAGVSSSIRRVNQYLPKWITAKEIQAKCQETGFTFRQRKLSPFQTILLGILMILRANASLATGRIMAGGSFSTQALNKALNRLPLALLAAVSQTVIEAVLKASRAPRTLLVDCCNYYLADSRALRKHYKHPRQKKNKGRLCDYPQIRVLSVFDMHTGLMIAQFDFPSDQHESPQLERLLGVARPGDTLVFDRGFVSYANLHRLQEAGIHFVGRLPSNLHAQGPNSKSRRRYVHAGRRGSGQVIWEKPVHPSKGVTNEAWKQLPASLSLRQVTRKVRLAAAVAIWCWSRTCRVRRPARSATGTAAGGRSRRTSGT